MRAAMKALSNTILICCSYVLTESNVFAQIKEATHVDRLTLETNLSTSNPYEQGCLFSHGVVSKIRVCNSEDPPEAPELGRCRIPDIDYLEIRIHSDVWESIAFEAWIVQVILSEILDVPTTIEPGAGGSLNFYHHDASFTFGSTDDNAPLQTAYNAIDCRTIIQNGDKYQGCYHFGPERWTG